MMRPESLGAVNIHSIYKIKEHEINNKKIDRGDYANMSIDIKSIHNLLFLYAKICFINKNMVKESE